MVQSTYSGPQTDPKHIATQDQITQLLSSINDLTGLISGNTQNISGFSSQIQSLVGSVSTLNTANQQNAAAITNLNNTLNSINQQLTNNSTAIADLAQLVDDLELYTCTDEIELNKSTPTSTEITISHPAMTCVEVCIFDKTEQQWTSAPVEILNNTSLTIKFRSPPTDGRYCAVVKGKIDNS